MKPALSRSIVHAVWLFMELAFLSGCTVRDSCTVISGRSATLATLYFGRKMNNGGQVSDNDWRRFLSSEVTPAFPNGFTVSDGLGQWMDPTHHMIITENSKILAIVVFNDPALDDKLDRIRKSYRVSFHQDSVGVTLAPVCASF